jgi:raffinose/stachyose/melibiose transport system permease protein
MLDAPASRNLLYVLPGLAIYAAFVFGPILAALVLSFTEWNGLSRPILVGLGNYLKLFSDPLFFIALRNNAILILFYSVLPLAVGICLAAILSTVGNNRERLALRTLLFMPYIMPTAVLGIIWRGSITRLRPINQGSA